MPKSKVCHYPECDCAVSFPEGHRPSVKTECPRCTLMVLEQEFTQPQIVAILGMYTAGIHGQDPKKFEARFKLETTFDDANNLSFSAHLKMVEIDS